MYEKKNPNTIWYLIIGVVVLTLVMLGLLALLMKGGGDEDATETGTTQVTEQTTKQKTEQKTEKKTEGKSSGESSPAASDLKFRDQAKKDQHYKKHGKEMGFADADAYEAAAAAVAADPSSLHKLEKEDGDDVYYRERDNAFVVVSTDGYIRTFFYPNGGKSYYDRQ